jgi:hypothetical protein
MIHQPIALIIKLAMDAFCVIYLAIALPATTLNNIFR